MKYATYKVYFPEENNLEGTTPHVTVRANGKFIETAFSIDNVTDVCYVGDNVTASGLSNWSFKIITQSEALELALKKNANSYLTEDGTINMPFDDPYLNSI
jgi:hypothetical protein